MNSSLRFLNFSPNSSKLNSPLAESTAFGTPLGAKYQPTQKRKSISPIYNANKQRQNVKIDPHVLTDAQSNGIVTRLVKYYEKSNEPDRNRIVYNKFGDFPIVQLKKTELKRPIITRTSSVRIAPPNKTIMNPNLRAAIMRSNSCQLSTGISKVVPTKMRAKDDSHKIITNHEPIIDTNYPVSSKSVLDALEKNCRKRISNEELTLDRSKKFCAPEVVDSPSPKEFMTIPQSAKRNREEISPGKVVEVSNQQSKRFKIRNNALLSSLSSSHYELPVIPVSSSTSIKNVTRIQAAQKETEVVESKTVRVETEETNKPKDVIIQSVPEPTQKKLQLFNVQPDKNAAINRAKLKAYETRLDDDNDEDEFRIRFVKPKENVLENYESINYVERDKLDKMLKGLSHGVKSPTKDIQEKSKDIVDAKTQPEKQPVASISFTTSTTSSTIAPITTPASTSNAVISINPPSVTFKLSEKSEEKKDSGSAATSVTQTQVSTEAPATTSITSNLPKPILGGFQFGSTSADPQKSTAVTTPSITTTTIASISPLNVMSSKPISPLALFSTPKMDAPVVDSNKSLISFTPLKASETATTTQSTGLVTTTTTSSSIGGFKFGDSTKTDLKLLTPGGFSFGTSSTEKGDSQPKLSTGFSFGNKTAAATVTTTAPTSFSFGSNIGLNTQTVAPTTIAAPQIPTLNFQNPVSSTVTAVPSATTNLFSFGSNAAPTPQPAAANTFGITSPLTSNVPSSFSKPETTVASGIGFSFGSSTTAKPAAFSFGSSMAAPQAISIQPAVVSTTSITSPSSTPAFSFGSNQLSAQPSGIFPSGIQSVATTAPPVFGSSTISSASPFGAMQPKQDSAGAFSFGAQNKPQTAPVASTNFSFGSPMSNANTALSAQPAQQSNAFSFGGSDNSSTKSSGIFSRLGDKQSEAKPFSFGSSGNLQASSKSPSFGNSVTSAPTIFGNAAASPSVFGQVGSSNIFSNQTSSPFGGSASQPAAPTGNNLFAFGTNSTSSNSQPQQQQQQPGIFGFGTTTNNAQQSSNNSIFGSSNTGQNVSASFTFNTATGSVTNSQNRPFGQTTGNSAPPPYQFGSANSNNNSNTVSASFTFSPQQQQQHPQSGPTSPQSAPLFSFGNATPSLGTGGAFNFQGQQQQAVGPQASAAGNLFNIGTGGNKRPTRVATRRYK